MQCTQRLALLAARLELGGGGAWLSNVTDAADLGDILGQLASMIDLTGKKQQPWQYQVSANVTQNIWDGGASALGKKTAEAVAAKDEAELEVSLYELQRQVDEVFFSILLLEERLKQAKGRISVLELQMKKLDVDLSPKIGFVADAYYGYPGRNIFKGLTDHNPSFNAMCIWMNIL